MNKDKNKKFFDKKKILRQEDHLTRPPRLEGAVKEAMMQPVRKKKRKRNV
jgi:hypothetical protein